ncbi:hypothetical protein FRB94_013151 [Tulasnella sp. JGI-2019a]|nr:hypothetical protein FRB94_013151 [Tulasnella sp. JGI-2019a]
MSQTLPVINNVRNCDVSLKVIPPTPPMHPSRSSNSSVNTYVPPPLANSPEHKLGPSKLRATLSPPSERPSSPSRSSLSSHRVVDKFRQWKSSSRFALGENGRFAVPPTEEELREIYEEEEIQRFLNLFHANIEEVTLPSAMTSAHLPTGEFSGAGQKIVIVAQQDVGKVTAARAAPASAAVEAIPQSLATQLGLNKIPAIVLNDDDDDDDDDGDNDDSSMIGSEGPDSDAYWDDESIGEVFVDKDDGWLTGMGVSGDKDKEDLENDTGAISTAQGGRYLTPEDQLPSHQKPKKQAIKRERVWGSEIAADYISQFIPQGRAMEARNRRGGKHEKFSFTRLKTAGQRTYLSTYPLWVPLVLNLWNIARWIDWNYSLKLCCIWWILWWLNMLLSGFLWYLVYQLIKHRILPYPTLKQLEERRQRALEAEKLIGTISGATSKGGNGDDDSDDAAPRWKSAMGLTSLGLRMGIGANTLLANNVATPLRTKVKDGARIAVGAMTGHWGKKGKEGVDEETKMDYVEEDEELVDRKRRRKANDWRRLGLIALEELADLHERLRNLMLWRRAESTRVYTIVIAALAFIVMITPAQYLAKGTYAAMGFVYWFIIPTLCAMTRKQRALLPSPFFDIPTDAEYAMEIIARRLRHGYSVTPDRKTNRNLEYIRGSSSNLSVNNLAAPSRNRSRESLSVLSGIVGGGIGASLGSPVYGGMLSSPVAMEGHSSAIPKATADRVQKPTGSEMGVSENGGQAPVGGPDAMDVSPAIPRSTLYNVGGIAKREGLPIQAQTFSAHYRHLPGILTITDSNIEFTPLSLFNKLRKDSDDPKITINLDCIRGIKKAGARTKSLLIRFIEPVAVDGAKGASVNGSTRKDSVGGYHTVDNPKGDRDAIIMAEREVKFKWVGCRDEVFARLVASKQSTWVPV